MDYVNMSAVEATRYAKDLSGLSVEELHQRTGFAKSTLNQFFRNQDGYPPSLEKIPKLCRVMGNTVLLQWLEAQVSFEKTENSPAKTRAEILTLVAVAGASFGNVQQLIAENDVVYPETARELRSALNDVIFSCKSIQDSLQNLASERGHESALACLPSPENKSGRYAVQKIKAWLNKIW